MEIPLARLRASAARFVRCCVLLVLLLLRVAVSCVCAHACAFVCIRASVRACVLALALVCVAQGGGGASRRAAARAGTRAVQNCTLAAMRDSCGTTSQMVCGGCTDGGGLVRREWFCAGLCTCLRGFPLCMHDAELPPGYPIARRQMNSALLADPVADADGMVYFMNADGGLIAFNSSTSMPWRAHVLVYVCTRRQQICVSARARDVCVCVAGGATESTSFTLQLCSAPPCVSSESAALGAGAGVVAPCVCMSQASLMSTSSC